MKKEVWVVFNLAQVKENPQQTMVLLKGVFQSFDEAQSVAENLPRGEAIIQGHTCYTQPMVLTTELI